MYVFCEKLLLVFVLISVLLITYSQQIIDVQLVSISNIFKNRVGNDWSHDVTVIKKPLSNYKYLSLKFFESNTLKLKANCCEFDEKYPYNDSITKIIDISNVYVFNIEVIVTENRGCFSGNKAR